MADKLSKMRDAAGPLMPTRDNGGLFEDTSKGKPALRAVSTGETKKLSRQRFTVNLRDDVIEQARAAVYYTPGLTLSSLVEKAIKAEIEALEAARKEPFPTIEDNKLSPGRPIKLHK